MRQLHSPTIVRRMAGLHEQEATTPMMSLFTHHFVPPHPELVACTTFCPMQSARHTFVVTELEGLGFYIVDPNYKDALAVGAAHAYYMEHGAERVLPIVLHGAIRHNHCATDLIGLS